MNNRLLLLPAFLPLLLFSACSSSVSITTTRLTGVVLDRSMAVEVGNVHGQDAEEFRQELADAVGSMRERQEAGVRGQEAEGTGAYATLVIEGTYSATADESINTETIDGKRTEKTDLVYLARFDYRITHKESGEEITFGSLEESKSRSYEQETRGFLESIFNAIVRSVLSGDPYASLRENLVARFVADISPHEHRISVTLYEDSDMPELEEGIANARAGRWKEALAIFLDAIDRHQGHEEIHKAYYNAGVAYEYTHQYSLAREFMERALSMSYEEEYADELRRCARYEQEWKWREGYMEKLRMMK
jgi:tetratricopeptide (TPR) repeat protein